MTEEFFCFFSWFPQNISNTSPHWETEIYKNHNSLINAPLVEILLPFLLFLGNIHGNQPYLANLAGHNAILNLIGLKWSLRKSFCCAGKKIQQGGWNR